MTWLVLLFSHYVLCPLMFHSNVTTSPRRLQRRLLPFLSLFHLCLLHLPLLLISSFSPATQLTKHTVLSLQQRNGKPQSQLVLSNETDVNRPPIHNHVIYLRQREKKSKWCPIARTLGTRGVFSRATRSFVGRRPTRLRLMAEYTSVNRNRKPSMKSLWHPG